MQHESFTYYLVKINCIRRPSAYIEQHISSGNSGSSVCMVSLSYHVALSGTKLMK